MPDHEPQPASPPPARNRWRWIATAPWEQLAMWGLLLVALCMLRHLMLVIFLTFMLCYVVRHVIDALAARFWPNQHRRWLERLLILAMFGMLFVGAWAAGRLLGPFALSECQELAARASKVDPDYEFHQVLNRTVGAYAFRQQYGDLSSPRYQQEFREFVEQGRNAVVAYDEFPTVEATVHRTIEAKMEGVERARVSAELARQGAANGDSQQESRTLAQQLEAAEQSAAFQDQIRARYAACRQSRPQLFPYNYATYASLKAAYPKGRQAFVEAWRQTQTAGESATPAQLQEAFEKEKRRELAANWWTHSEAAVLIRHHTEAELSAIADNLGQRAGSFVSGLLSLPSQLITVLLLSLFITVDFASLRAGVLKLKQSRLNFLFDDLFPGIARIGNLIGKSFVAQGIVSLINAALTFLAMLLLGVENALLLSVVVFIFSFVPVIGIILSSIPIALMAVIQPDGSLWLALWAIGAIVVIHLIEATFLGPKIVGKMLHLHPVLGIVVLAIGEHYFGIWGLLLAYPVAVYLISRVLGEEEASASAHNAHS
jgi:predicted PurR-regulated permease PerM